MAYKLTRCLFVAASSLLVAVGLTPTAAKAQEMIEEITWALPAVLDTLFVPRAWNTYEGAIMSLVQEGFLAFGDDLSLIDGVTTVTQTDATTYKYKIRPGVTFGDGSPLTPDDIVTTVKWHLDPASASPLAAFWSSVDTVEASGTDEVTITLNAPNVQYQYSPAHMAGFVFKKSQLEEHPDDMGTPEVLPLGTGPYRLVEFVPNERVVLEARDDYWGTKPVVKTINIVSIPDRQTRLLAMRNGDIDGTFDLAISDVDQWKALDNVDVITAPSLGVYNFTLDQSKPPFDDVHVRKAVAYSVDRAGLVQALLKGNGEPATALNPPEMWTGVLSLDEVKAFYATIPGYAFDFDKAKAELAQSGHPDGFEIDVQVPTADPYAVNILQSIAENVKQIGITINVKEVDNNKWLADFFNHENLGMSMMSYFPDFVDAANYPYLFFHSDNAAKDGLNGSNFINAEVDAQLTIANEQSDPAVRAEALKAVFRIVNEEAVNIPVFWPASAMAINKKYKLTGYNAFWYNVPWAIRGFGLK